MEHRNYNESKGTNFTFTFTKTSKTKKTGKNIAKNVLFQLLRQHIKYLVKGVFRSQSGNRFEFLELVTYEAILLKHWINLFYTHIFSVPYTRLSYTYHKTPKITLPLRIKTNLILHFTFTQKISQSKYKPKEF